MKTPHYVLEYHVNRPNSSVCLGIRYLTFQVQFMGDIMFKIKADALAADLVAAFQTKNVGVAVHVPLTSANPNRKLCVPKAISTAADFITITFLSVPKCDVAGESDDDGFTVCDVPLIRAVWDWDDRIPVSKEVTGIAYTGLNYVQEKRKGKSLTTYR